MSWSVEQTVLLIEEYSKHPCLYVVKNKDYHNKQLRSLALQKLVESVGVLKPLVTEQDIQKKFLGLRTTYSNERKKVLASIHSGMGEDEIYKPALWYYHKMEFLNEHLVTRASKSSFQLPPAVEFQSQAEEGVQLGGTQTEKTLEVLGDSIIFDGDYDIMHDGFMMKSPAAESDSRSVTPSRPSSPVAGPSKAKKRNLGTLKRQEDPDMMILTEVSRNLEKVAGLMQPMENIKKNSDQAFGEFVALQLEKIKDEDIKNEVQYQIHGILRDALKKRE